MWLSKYSASGNDFLICHTFKKTNRAALARKLCDRFEGIGADGFVVLLPHAKYAYCWDFYNSDGSKAKMCGNAARCVGHYALSHHFAPRKHSFLSGAGEIKLEVQRFTRTGGIVKVDFGKVRILKEKIYENNLHWSLLDSGVPHLVSFVGREILQNVDIKILRTLRKKYDANVNLAYVKNDKTIELCTFERGVENITKACGTGIASVFYAAQKNGFIKSSAHLIPPHGENVRCELINDDVKMTGSVKKIGDVKIDF